MKKLLFIMMLFATQIAVAQNTILKGVITDIEGTPLQNIYVHTDENIKTHTDTAGSFSIAVKPTGILYFHGVGFKDTTINVNNQTAINIAMIGVVNINAKVLPPAFNQEEPGLNANMADLASRMDKLQELPGNLNLPQQVSGPISGGGKPNWGSGSISTSDVVSGNTSGSALSTNPKTMTVRRDFIDMAQGAIFPQFNPKEETQGSRYYFKGWVHGVVLDDKSHIIKNPKYFFNYDKMGGGLLLSQDGHSAIEVNREQVKYFILSDENGLNAVTFANMPQLDKTHYVEVINEGSKLKIYKVIKTKFERANYSTDGLTSTGNNFDSYEDHFDYYIIDVKTGNIQLIALKKKAIKSAFETYDRDKTSKFMSDHGDDNIDDNYLASLSGFVNQ